MEVAVANVVSLLEGRIDAYDLLRRTFLVEPKREFCELIFEHDVVRSFPFINESHLIQEGVRLVQHYLENSDLSNEATYQELHWDYTRLFIGPEKLPTPPWESAYLNEERLLFQKETLDVRESYLEYNFLPKYFGIEADDHVGLELDFMYQLSFFSLRKYQNNNFDGYFKVVADQIAFLENHLTLWMPAFCKDVYRHASTDFYKGMSKILIGYQQVDLRALKELKEFS